MVGIFFNQIFANIRMSEGEDTIKEPLLPRQEDLPSGPSQEPQQTNYKLIQPTPDEVVKDDETEEKSKKDNSKEEEDKDKDKAESVSFMKLISLADNKDIFMMIVGTIAALGAGCVMPMFSFFFGDLTLVYTKEDPIHEALMAAIKFWIIAGAAWILNFLALYCWTASGQRQALRYRKMYYQLLLKQEVYWYDINNPNQLSTRISTQVTAITGGITQKVANILTVAVTSVLGFFLAYYRNWQLSLVISAILPAIMLAGFLVMKSMQIMTDKNTKTYSQAGAVAEQAIGSIRTIKGMVGELFQIDRYKQKLDESIGSSIKYNMYAGAAIGFMIMIFLGSYALGFWYGKKLIIEHTEYDISDIISCFFCIVMGGASLGQAAPALKNIAAAKSSAGEFWKLYERTPTLVEPEKGKKIKKIKSVEFKDVTFRYKKKDEKQEIKPINVINNLTLKLQKNKVTAIVGESGSGKSTLIQLLQRFYDPDEGSVLINGTDLKEVDIKQFRQSIGYVGQQPALFALSIRQNLLFAKQDATQEEMIDALKKANAYGFVSKMEKGLDTFVGTSGTQISGGQKQRIAIARAILKNPQMFIFDEATSALDRMNEKEIQKTLSKLSENITTLVIAHRLSTIQNADHIVVLSKGRIVQEGTHEVMIANKSFYYDLVKNQLLVEQTKEQNADQLEEIQDINLVKRKQSEDVIQKPSQSQNDETNKKQQDKIQKEKEAKVFGKLLKDSSENWVWYLGGSLCAIANGVVFPMFSLFLSRLIGLMVQLKDETKDQEEIRTQINYYCLGFLGVAVIGGITTFMYHSAFGYVGQKLVYKIRQKVFKKLMRLKVSYYDSPDNNPGAVTTKLAQDAFLVHGMTTGVIGVIILNISTAGTGLFIAFFHHWMLTLIVLGLSPLIALAGSINMKKLKDLATQSNEAYKEAGNQISDTVTNIRTVKSFGKLNYIKAEFAEKLSEPYELAKTKAMNNGFFQGLSQASIMIVYGLIFYLAAVINEKVSGQKHQTSDIFTAIFAVVFAAAGMGNNTSLMPDMAKGKTAGANLYEILEEKDEYQQSLEEGGVVRENIRGQIEFRDVCFKYPSRQKKVFNNLNIKIGALQKTAFVGQSGCGKSTIFQLLLRFYQPTQGQIRIDGRNIKEYDLYYLRSQIGLVLQQPTLFTGTIFDNIRYKNTTATENDVIEAAKIAQADYFIEKLENKYQSDVGNKGTKLSGGQKQRIALARCILMKPHLFMFDEATSALDTETEKKVFESLKKVTTGKTCLSIAHRLSTIIDNDQIYVFSEGKVIEQGSYKELVDKGGFFYRLERGQH